MKQKIIIKIGGSLITEKDVYDFPLDIGEIKKKSNRYIRKKVVKRLGNEIKDALSSNNIELIIINGAGPFGHFLVEHGVPHEDINESVRHLNEKFVEELRELNLPIVPISPSKSCSFGEDLNIDYLWEITEMLLEEGKILSVYGDDINGKIISGDDLAIKLAERWEADKIIMATDVDGIFRENPKHNPNSDIIEIITKDNINGVNFSIDVPDVTGGMKNKVKKLLQISKMGVTCQIINGLKPNNLKSAILGEKIGTLIKY